MKTRLGMKVMALLVGSLMVFGSRGTASAAEKEPTLQETLEWLKGKINVESGVSHRFEGGDNRYEKIKNSYDMRVEGGIVILQETLSMDGNVNTGRATYSWKYTMQYKIPLKILTATVSAKETKPSIPYVGFRTASGPDPFYTVKLQVVNNKPEINYHRVSETTESMDGKILEQKREEKDDKTWGVGIAFADKAIAERVAKAFAHAIILSGGKNAKEPF